LAAAIQVHGQVIVTANVKDFPPDALAPYNIEAQTPDVFLTDLLDLAPDAVVSIIEQQAQALTRQPHSPERALDSLARHAPRFAALVRPRIQEAAAPALVVVRRRGA